MNIVKKIAVVLLLTTATLTQAQVSVNVNLGTPPAWGPAGYTEARYYYLPDIETYYDVNNSEYIYLTNGRWMRTRSVPAPYRRYNFYNGYKVVMTDYRGAEPYRYYKTYKTKYPKGYKGPPQKNIGVPPGHAKKIAGHHGPGKPPKGKAHGKGKH